MKRTWKTLPLSPNGRIPFWNGLPLWFAFLPSPYAMWSRMWLFPLLCWLVRSFARLSNTCSRFLSSCCWVFSVMSLFFLPWAMHGENMRTVENNVRFEVETGVSNISVRVSQTWVHSGGCSSREAGASSYWTLDSTSAVSVLQFCTLGSARLFAGHSAIMSGYLGDDCVADPDSSANTNSIDLMAS